jgi:hypothetical protein
MNRRCEGCARPLRRGKALRCARCRKRYDRDRKRRSRARDPSLPFAPIVPEPPVEEPFPSESEEETISRQEAVELLRDPTNWPPVGTPEWDAAAQIVDEAERPAKPARSEPTPRPLDVPTSQLTEDELLRWLRDPSCAEVDRWVIVAELRRRQDAASPENREEIARLLATHR